MSASHEPTGITCASLHAALPAYRAGVLDTNDAWRLERHAAHCTACASLLDAPLAAPLAVPLDADTRSAMRTYVLAQLTPARAGGAVSRRWGLRAAAVLAAASIAVLLRQQSASHRSPAGAATPGSPSHGAPMATAIRLAESSAAAEFAALDAAAQELTASILAAPNDAELRRFRDALDTRRRELARRIESVPE
jgi:hypothetical protein